MFQSMMSGAECSTGSTPLASLLKQQNTDHSLHQPGFNGQQVGAGPSFRSSPGLSGKQLEEAERFFQQGSGPVTPKNGGSQMGMENLRRELERVARNDNQGSMKGDREWASQYHPAGANLNPAEMAQMEEQFRQNRGVEQFHQSHRPTDLSNEFFLEQQRLKNHSIGPSGPTATPAGYSQPSFAPAYGAYNSGMSMMGMQRPYNGGMGMMMGGGGYGVQQQPEAEVIGKGKGRIVELNDEDWEAQFARVNESSEKEEQDLENSDRLGDSLTKETDTVNLLDGEIPIDATEADAELLKNLEATWSNLQSTLTDSSISDAEMAAWEAQYGSQFANLDGDSGLGDDLNDMGSGMKAWTKENVDSFLQNEAPYPFTEENEYLSHPDPFSEGQRLLAEGAPLSEAALAFEAACRLDPERAEAWKAAGETWAADEREVKGIRALEKAVACGGPDGVGAWMSLAVSYVNEGEELRALATLERWLSLAYPSISAPTPAPAALQQRNPWDSSNRIIDLFLSAARSGPSIREAGQQTEETRQAAVDPDVQVGLGVLFYSHSDYERAKDCFEAALSVRPTDFLLWNRLGATLANGGLPEEAISAYRKALDLRPTFTRATYNLGVSCLNIGCYQEAAEHLLAAIEGQMLREKAPGVPGLAQNQEEDGSSNLWHTLRRAFLCMERHDLAEKAHAGTSLTEFRKEGFEF